VLQRARRVLEVVEMALRVRCLTGEERAELRRRAQSRTAPARVVERARMILAVDAGQRVPEVAGRLGVGADVVRQWIKRFDAEGLPGLEDRPRSGRPVTYTPEQVGQVLATAASNPTTLGLPFGAWTLDRLAAYLHERPSEAGGPLPISRSHLDRLLVGEGLRWRREETWFGERVDPQFAEKRGRSSGSAPARRPAAWWSTSMRWARPAPRAIRA
jgi:transposase